MADRPPTLGSSSANIELSSNALAKESIAYRFESQSTIDDAKQRREDEWKEAYARLGQEPPKMPEEIVDDGKTLFERLEIQKNLKTEEWDNKMKLGNQWRGLGADELKFLAEKAELKRKEEESIKEAENRELAEYREALAARHAAPAPLAATSSSSQSATTKKVPPKPARKDVKSLMKGIVVKKKPKAAPAGAGLGAETQIGRKRPAEDVGSEKKQKVEDSR